MKEIIIGKRKTKCGKVAALLMVAASATVPTAVNAGIADTWTKAVHSQTYGGVEWSFKIDETRYTAVIGTNTAAVNQNIDFRATSQALTGKWTLPEYFTVDGVNYTVTAIGNSAFYSSSSLTSIVFPSGVHQFYRHGLRACSGLKSIWFKGPATVKDGEQIYKDMETDGSSAVGNAFTGLSACKCVLVGPYLNCTVRMPTFGSSSGCTFFLPRNSDNTTWESYSPGGTTPVKQYYGAGEDLDLAIDEEVGTITATISTAVALTNVLGAVATFKEDFGLDTKINITNAFEIGEGLITAENMQYATFNSLMFKVTTQAQFDSILSAVPASVPLAIDASDAKTEIVSPRGRKVYALISDEGRNGKYTPKIKGLIIQFF